MCRAGSSSKPPRAVPLVNQSVPAVWGAASDRKWPAPDAVGLVRPPVGVSVGGQSGAVDTARAVDAWLADWQVGQDVVRVGQ